MLLQADRPWLAEEQIGDVTVVTVQQSELLDEAVIQSISEQLYRLVEQPYRQRLVLNLAEVERLSSRMLGTFVALHKMLHRAGGKFVLCGIDRQLLEIFTLFRLSQALLICREEQEALQAF
jgi:anti-anti-sigma factor